MEYGWYANKIFSNFRFFIKYCKCKINYYKIVIHFLSKIIIYSIFKFTADLADHAWEVKQSRDHAKKKFGSAEVRDLICTVNHLEISANIAAS